MNFLSTAGCGCLLLVSLVIVSICCKRLNNATVDVEGGMVPHHENDGVQPVDLGEEVNEEPDDDGFVGQELNAVEGVYGVQNENYI